MSSIAGIELDDSQVVWLDEFSWSPVGQSAEADIQGGLVVEYLSPNRDGRPVTLDLGWITKATLDALIAKRDADPQELMSLVLPDARSMDVLWRHHDADPIEAEPVKQYTEYVAGDLFQTTLNLMQVL
jgi:hypothetical protein